MSLFSAQGWNWIILLKNINWNFPIAGKQKHSAAFIIQNRDEIPKQKETFTVGNYQFDILNVSDTRIETVKMKVLK
jgi:Mg2+/Co2+ transporter CorB